MKGLYLSEVKIELAKGPRAAQHIITEKDLAPLPEAVQKYFRHCGYLGKIKMRNAEITWEDVHFKMSPQKNWIRLQCYQFNSVPEPCRIAYMKSRFLGFIPLEGRDKYQDGYGNMLFKLFKFIRVADAKSTEMDQSALVTVLAECFMVPTYALQEYIHWYAIDSQTAKAVLKYQNCEVSGIFYFNEHGEFIRFETDDRYYSEKGTEYKRYKWSVVAGTYLEKNGVLFPSYLKSSWHTEAGEYEYFNGKVSNIRFNIS